ncbi:hypothetical protein LBMAG44_17150 [Gemmatimonadota bacterium]|nr:hypothetical protein LBMAG44_17150 [Gemmatimonadota bacterium]
MPSRDLATPSVVILVADGARPDTLAAAMDRGELPALSKLRAEGGLHTVTSVFPSVTGPAYTPFLMGRFPGPVGLPGIRWYDRERAITRWPVFSRSYVGLGLRELSRDLDPAAPTMFELVDSRLSALSVIERGLARREKVARGARFVTRAAFTHFRGDVSGWLAIDRHVGRLVADRIAHERPQFAFCALTGIDKASHALGHDAPLVRTAMQIVDQTAARIRDDAERDGRWEQMHLWIVSDHGHSPVHTHEDLTGLLRSHSVRTRAHPWTWGAGHRAAVMVSGNAMAHISLDLNRRDRPWWPALAERWEWLTELLMSRESTDLLILPVSAAECEVRHRTRGVARICWRGAQVSYLPQSGDPLGLGELRDLDSTDAHNATVSSEYPDALVQISSLAASPRCGDIVLSAARGWDFRAKWEPIPHVSAHGALHREHMAVPLLVNRPVAQTPLRTVDVFPTALAALGLINPARCDGRSWLANA